MAEAKQRASIKFLGCLRTPFQITAFSRELRYIFSDPFTVVKGEGD
jgi:hypothetical protein